MNRNVWIGGVAAFALAIAGSAAAQTTSSTQPPSSSNTPSAITVSGCLQQGSQMGGAVGTSGTTATNPSSSSASANEAFVLKTGKSGTSAATSGTSPSATAGTSGSMSGTTYLLQGDSAELKTHVNEEVEIKGRIESAASGSSAATSGSSAASSPRLQVESVRTIASTCSSK